MVVVKDSCRLVLAGLALAATWWASTRLGIEIARLLGWVR